MNQLHPLLLEALEDRTVPATFDVPWQLPRLLTLSFAWDGTPIAGHTSELFQLLDPQFAATADWQGEIVRAFQTWAAHVNVSVGLQDESFDLHPFGITGRMQGDGRFGDIRVGAHRMTDEVLSISVPPDPFLAGTLAGDVFLNSTRTFDAQNLFAVLLHEAGHVLGLGHSDDPLSPMYSHFSERTELTPGDVAAVQELYGIRGPDRNEPNDVCGNATRIRYSNISPEYTGETPLVVYGDRTALQDTDRFWLRPIEGYNGPVTFRLQTAGLSFLAPRLTVLEEDRDCRGTPRVVGQAQATDVFGATVAVTVPRANRNFHYHAVIDSPRGDLFSVGRYALGVTFDERVVPAYLDRLDAVMRGPYDTLAREQDINRIFRSPADVVFNDDEHTNDTFATATVLASVPGYLRDSRYEAPASLGDDTDVDFYLVRAARRTTVLTATFLQANVNGVLPEVLVFDANREPVPNVDVLLNGNGTYTVQAWDLSEEADYYLQVLPQTGTPQVGNYTLLVDLGKVTASLRDFAGGTLDEVDPIDEYAFYVAQSQLFQFVLSAGTPGLAQDAQVRMEIFDGDGRLVFSLVGRAGETVSDSSVFLTPGEYRARFTVESTGGGPPPVLPYRLRGINLTDPIGPAIEDPLLDPMYVCEEDPSQFCYPGDIISVDPFLWVLLS